MLVMAKTVWDSHSLPTSKARYLTATEKIVGTRSLSAIYRHITTDLLAGIILTSDFPACHGTHGTVYPK